MLLFLHHNLSVGCFPSIIPLLLRFSDKEFTSSIINAPDIMENQKRPHVSDVGIGRFLGQQRIITIGFVIYGRESIITNNELPNSIHSVYVTSKKSFISYCL